MYRGVSCWVRREGGDWGWGVEVLGELEMMGGKEGNDYFVLMLFFDIRNVSVKIYTNI